MKNKLILIAAASLFSLQATAVNCGSATAAHALADAYLTAVLLDSSSTQEQISMATRNELRAETFMFIQCFQL